MSKAPWYLQQEAPGLGHLKNWKEGSADGREVLPVGSQKWKNRTKKTFQATKYRKGACENCGSMSHKRVDCLERPRAKSAKNTSTAIAADEFLEEDHGQKASYDAKRDRWAGFEADDYARVVERYERLQELKVGRGGRHVERWSIVAGRAKTESDGILASVVRAAIHTHNTQW